LDFFSFLLDAFENDPEDEASDEDHSEVEDQKTVSQCRQSQQEEDSSDGCKKGAIDFLFVFHNLCLFFYYT